MYIYICPIIFTLIFSLDLIFKDYVHFLAKDETYFGLSAFK